jgi:hypothetical protein
VELPDLSQYRPHRTVRAAEFEGVPVPGLHAEFFHRDLRDRVASVGCYSYAGRELLMAWGFVGEEHCRYSAVRGEDGWDPPTPGCPQVRVLRDNDHPDAPVIGFLVRDRRGSWIDGRSRKATAS